MSVWDFSLKLATQVSCVCIEQDIKAGLFSYVEFNRLSTISVLQFAQRETREAKWLLP
jgi:hypothetical protein